MLKKAARKILSLVLAAGVVFSGGISNLYASAQGGAPGDNSMQLTGRYAEMNDKGTIVGESYNSLVTKEDGKVQIKKTVSPTDTENVFDVNLEVVTKDELKKVEISPDAAVVLVMDVSSSMETKVPGTWSSRLSKAKDAAKKFVDSYTQDANGAKRMISVVKFGNDADTVVGWTDAAQNSDNVKSQIQKKVTVPSSWNGVGTNIEGGLMLARNLLGSNAIKGIENVYVIMLTDGQPTYHVNRDSTSTTHIDGARGGGISSEWEDYKDVPGIASQIKQKADALYSISYATGKTNVGGQTVQQWLNSFVTHNYDASESDDLNLIFENISLIIRNNAKAWIVTDPMGENILFDTDYNTQNNGFSTASEDVVRYYDTKTQTITWNVKADAPKITGTGYNKTYTYTLRYRIKLDTASKPAPADGLYLTNGRTYLTYMLMENAEVVDPELRTVNFKVPYVKGFWGDLSFTKTDAENGNKALAGAVFALEGTATGSGRHVSMKAESQAGGSVSFQNIPAGEYTLKETKAPAGYESSAETYKVTVSYGKVTVNGMKTNDHGQYVLPNELSKVDISVKKVWKGVEKDDLLPDSVTVTLTQNGEETGKTLTLSAANGWKGTFTDLREFDENGKAYTYGVKESAVNGYTSKVTGGAQQGFTVTNTYAPDAEGNSVDISGTKTWVDNNNEDGTRPASITIELYADGEKVKETTADASGGWKYSFENLPKYGTNSREIVYTVKEQEVDGYSSAVSGYDITNTLSQKKISVSGTKTWIDPQGTVHPDVTIVLKQDGVEADRVTLKNGKTFYSFKDLDKYDQSDGHVYEYTVEELPVEGYTSEQDGTNFINTIKQDNTVEVSGTKTWVAPEGTVHPTITINLLRDGKAVESRQLENGETTYSFTNLPKYDLNDGHVYAYTVEEEPVEGYTSVQTGTNFTNTIQQDDTVSVSGTKTWIAPQGTVHPDVTIVLKQDGVEVNRVTLKNGTTSYTFDGLDKYDLSDGHVYEYTVEELPVEGYTSEQEGTNFINTIKQDNTVEVSGTKTWIAPQGTVHPDVTIVLNQDGKEYKRVTLKNGETTYSFTNLPKYDLDDGHVYAYTVEEEPVEGYTPSYNGYDITNTINQEKKSVSGTKTWIAPEGTEFPAITVNLLQDGTVIESVTLENGETAYSFDDLDTYAPDGHVYTYTVSEDAVEGYTSRVNGYDITNTVEQTVFDINGMKTWENVPDGEILPEITVILYKNGEEAGRTTASEDTYWEYSFQNLEQYDLTTGRENVYTVAEVPVEGYETQITGYDIVNTYATEEIPDDDTPLGPPDDGGTEEIPDDDTPLTPPDGGDGMEEIPDDDTPLGPPTTGEAENVLPAALAAVSVTGLFVLTIARRKTVKE